MVRAMVSPSPSPLRQLLEERVSQLLSEAEQWAGEARLRTTRDCVDRLNQGVRRIRQAGGLTELAAALVDASAGFAAGAALFTIQAETAKLENVRGAGGDALERLRAGVPLSAAPAMAGAIESRDPVIAAATSGEVSPAVAEAFGHAAEDRVFMLPLVTRERVPAILYAWGGVESSALELLAQVAAGAWIGLEPAPALVAIAPAPSGGWDNLPRDEQQIHLRAQRFARVRVAEMRLKHPDEVLAGRSRHGLYDGLRDLIDTARQAFQERFFAPCPSMVDYLHLELVRTLAHDDAELLGHDYPGPLV